MQEHDTKRTKRRQALNDITHARLLELLHYDPEAGVFTNRTTRGFRAKAGEVAGYSTGETYPVIKLDYVSYVAHRLAWFYMTGEWPKDQIDHIDRDKKNFKFSNLREATCAENHQNLPLYKRNKSGFPGVSYDARAKSWAAQIVVNQKIIKLGRFVSPEDAYQAYKMAKADLHKFHPEPAPIKKPSIPLQAPRNCRG